MLGTNHTTAQCHGPGDSNLQRHCWENVRSHGLISLPASVVVEILVAYFGKIMKFDRLVVVSVTLRVVVFWDVTPCSSDGCHIVEGPIRLTGWHHTPADRSPGTVIFSLQYCTTLICKQCVYSSGSMVIPLNTCDVSSG